MYKALTTLEMLSSLCRIVAITSVLLLTVVMLIEVGMRYIFGAPTTWSYEISYMMNGVIFVYGLSWVSKCDDHINVDFLSQKFSPRTRARLNLVVYLCFIFPLFSWLGYHLTGVTEGYFQSDRTTGLSAWNPVMWPYSALITMGVIAAAIQFMATLLRNGIDGYGRVGADQ